MINYLILKLLVQIFVFELRKCESIGHQWHYISRWFISIEIHLWVTVIDFVMIWSINLFMVPILKRCGVDSLALPDKTSIELLDWLMVLDLYIANTIIFTIRNVFSDDDVLVVVSLHYMDGVSFPKNVVCYFL